MVLNKKFWVILEAIMLIIWVITLIIFLTQVFSDGVKCLNNPINFGIVKISSQNNVDYVCKCSFENDLNHVFTYTKDNTTASSGSIVSLNYTGG